MVVVEEEKEEEKTEETGIDEEREAAVPWQHAVEAGKMAAGDRAPGQIWSSGPSSVLLSLMG